MKPDLRRGTFAAVYVVYDDTEWLNASFSSVYGVCDAVYFLLSDKPWRGPATDNSHTTSLITHLPDPQKKVHIVFGSWRDETSQRNAGLSILSRAKIDYCFIVDADEIYDPLELARMMIFASCVPEVSCWHMQWITYWKSMRHRIDPPEIFKPPVFVRVGRGKFKHYRLVEADRFGVVPPNVGVCHHMSYARSDAEMQRKLASFSHSDEIIPGWYEDVWQKWDSDPGITNLHPIHPDKFKGVVEQPVEALPPGLRGD